MWRRGVVGAGRRGEGLLGSGPPRPWAGERHCGPRAGSSALRGLGLAASASAVRTWSSGAPPTGELRPRRTLPPRSPASGGHGAHSLPLELTGGRAGRRRGPCSPAPRRRIERSRGHGAPSLPDPDWSSPVSSSRRTAASRRRRRASLRSRRPRPLLGPARAAAGAERCCGGRGRRLGSNGRRRAPCHVAALRSDAIALALARGIPVRSNRDRGRESRCSKKTCYPCAIACSECFTEWVQSPLRTA